MLSLPDRVVVVGMQRTGTAAAEALEARGVAVMRADRKLGNDDNLSLLDGVGLLVKSPGVPGGNPLVVEARRRDIPVWSEVELGYRLLGEPALLGVTGTNGKTTTCELLGAIFRAAGRDVVVAGNVGSPRRAGRTCAGSSAAPATSTTRRRRTLPPRGGASPRTTRRSGSSSAAR